MWVAICPELKNETDTSLATAQFAYRMAMFGAAGEVPKMLLYILVKAKGE